MGEYKVDIFEKFMDSFHSNDYDKNDKRMATLVYGIFSWIQDNIEDLTVDTRAAIDDICQGALSIMRGHQDGE